MELSALLQRLWRHRVLVALGLLVAALVSVVSNFEVSVSPPSIERPRSSFGAASRQIYIDTQRATLVSGQADEASSLVGRAQLVARFTSGTAVKALAARRLGIPVAAVGVTGPVSDAAGSSGTQPVAQERANQLLSAGSPYSVVVDTQSSAPTITFFAQAPTGREAGRLADAMVEGLRDYLADLRKQATPSEEARLAQEIRNNERSAGRTVDAQERRQRQAELFDGSTVIRSLGASVAGDVAEQSGYVTAVVTFVAVSILWCLAILAASGLVRRRRRPVAD